MVGRAVTSSGQPAVNKRTVLFVTGTRADFGKLKPLIQRVRSGGRFECDIFATGMHMLSRYGSTVNEIRLAGFDRVFSYINQDGAVSSQMDMVLANSIQGLGHYIREFPTDLIVIHGDRVEALAGAIVGALNNVLVAHVEGGEVSGTIDDLIRHSVTKLSHLHFVAHDEARDRLIQMGEAQASIFVIGSPDIDVMLSDTLPDPDAVGRKYEIPFERYGILLYHPVTTELGTVRRNAAAVVDAVERSGLPFVAIYPNNDTGSDAILDAYRRFDGNPRVRLIPSMRFEYFLTLLRNATVILGNSSAGVREAPVYGVPTVNVGSRQQNRFAYPSILHVPDEADAIVTALGMLPSSVAPSLYFGRGNSAELFVDALNRSTLWATERQKRFQDRPLVPVGAQ